MLRLRVALLASAGPRRPALLKLAGVLTLLTACAVGPNYIRPATEIPWAYREMEGWR